MRPGSKSRGAVMARMALEAMSKKKSTGRETPPSSALLPELTPENQAALKPLSRRSRQLLESGGDGVSDNGSDSEWTTPGRELAKRLRMDDGGSAKGQGSSAIPQGRQQHTLTAFFHRQPPISPALPTPGFFSPCEAQRPTQGLKKHLGMLNLGNTCYMNAVAQVLLGLKPFVADVLGPRIGDLKLQEDGIVEALRSCFLARQQSMRSHAGEPISLGDLKLAMERHVGFGHGSMQQDAHEFMCLLLQRLQDEVLGAEWRSKSGDKPRADTSPSVKLLETSCPVARDLEFSLIQCLVCSGCGRKSGTAERFSHLSLEIPVDGSSDLTALLGSYLDGGEVTKICESCGGRSTLHRLTYRVARLPRILILHLKRFQVEMPEEVSPVPCLRKLHSAVKHKHILSLGPWTQKDTLLPVPIASSSPKEDPSIMENKENLAFGTQEIKDGPAVPRLRVPVSSSAQSKPKQAASINAVHPQSSTAGRLHESEELKRGLEACPGSPLPPYYHQDSRFLPGCPSSESTLVPGVVTRTVREKASRTPQGLGKWQAEGTCEDEALQQVGLCLFLGRFEQLQGVTRLALLQALLESIKAAAGATVGEHVDHDDDPDLRRALEESLQEVASPAGEMYEKQAKSPSQAWQPSVRVVDEELEALLANRAVTWKGGVQVSDTDDGHIRHHYALRGIISHKGSQASEGHFIAEVQGLDSRWTCYDDSKVTTLGSLQPHEHRDRECYLLFYALEDASPGGRCGGGALQRNRPLRTW